MTDVANHHELSIELADSNYECVQDLFAKLSAAADDAGKSASDIAELMGIDAELVETILDGEYDVTLSDLQELALAIGAHVGYVVNSNVDKDFEKVLADGAADRISKTWYQGYTEDQLVSSYKAAAFRGLRSLHG